MRLFARHPSSATINTLMDNSACGQKTTAFRCFAAADSLLLASQYLASQVLFCQSFHFLPREHPRQLAQQVPMRPQSESELDLLWH